METPNAFLETPNVFMETPNFLQLCPKNLQTIFKSIHDQSSIQNVLIREELHQSSQNKVLWQCKSVLAKKCRLKGIKKPLRAG